MRAPVAILLLAAGCVPERGHFPGREVESRDSIIVGSLDWQEVTSLPPTSAERANSFAVGRLDLPAVSARCTASLIAPDVVLTNQHCVTSASDARGARMYFRHEQGVPRREWAEYTCDQFLGNDVRLDFALLGCRGRPGEVFGVLGLDGRAALQNQGLYVIHQNCDWWSDAGCDPTKKYSPGQVRSVGSEVVHDADTLGGSSGAPVFAEAGHQVLALHHAGSGGASGGRGLENYAVPMSAILPELLRRFPGLELGRRAPGGSAVDAGGLADAGPPVPADSGAPEAGSPDAAPLPDAGAAPDADVADAPAAPDAQPFDADPPDSGALPDAAGPDAQPLDAEPADSGALPDAAGPDAQPLDAEPADSGALPDAADPDAAGPDAAGPDATLPPGPGPDEFEPNESAAAAAAVPLPFDRPALRIAGANDEDWFVFIGDGQLRTIAVDFSHAAGDLDLHMYLGNGSLISESTGQTDREEITGRWGAGIQHYVRVEGWSGATGSYHLHIE